MDKIELKLYHVATAIHVEIEAGDDGGLWPAI